MGGDHAPASVLGGIKLSIDRGYVSPEQVVLTGPADRLRGELAAHGLGDVSIEIQDAPDVLDGDESPVDALRRKPRNSIAVGTELVKRGVADALVSAGSTGLVVVCASMALKRLEGIRKPGIAVTIEGESGPFTIVDVGANPQPKPLHLLHYGLMGAAYHHDAFGTENPRVGLMNIGSEDGKGSPLAKEAAELLRRADLNFVGNIEGVEMFTGKCDVIVADGFTGNVLLKVSEGVAEHMLRSIARLMNEAEVTEPKQKHILGSLQRRVDYSEYGGALLLGVDGIVTICHGRSGAAAIASAVRFALKAVGAHLNQHIVAATKRAEAADGGAA